MNKADFMSDYVNIKKIKKGGQKTVYKAQTLSGQDVALKLIYNAHDPRVLQEIEILTKLNIKNIPKIISSGYIKDDNSDEEVLYIVEDFIQGKSLRDYLNEGNKFSLKNAYNLLNKLLTIEVDLENKLKSRMFFYEYPTLSYHLKAVFYVIWCFLLCFSEIPFTIDCSLIF